MLVNIWKLSWWQNLKGVLLFENYRSPNYINFNELDIQEYENLRNWHTVPTAKKILGLKKTLRKEL